MNGHKDQLNCEQGYYFLFNKITDGIRYLQSVQRRAEELCIGERLPAGEPGMAEMLRSLADKISDG
jgi:hypothetical protein